MIFINGQAIGAPMGIVSSGKNRCIRIGDVHHCHTTHPIRHKCILIEDHHILSKSRCLVPPCIQGFIGIADVKNHKAVIPVSHKGISACDGNTMRIPRGLISACLRRFVGIADINDNQALFSISHIGIFPADSHPAGPSICIVLPNQ